jgi:flagellar motor switch protein FliN
MPAASVDTDRVNALLNDAAEAAANVISNAQLLAGVVAEGTLPTEFIPDDSSVGIRCKMRGLPGQLLLVVSGRVAEHLLETHQDMAGLLAHLDQGLTRAASVLDAAAPRAIRTGRSTEADPVEMLGDAGSAWWFGASPLFQGEEHVASLAIFLDDPVTAPSAEQELVDDDPEFTKGGVVDAPFADIDSATYTPPALEGALIGAAQVADAMSAGAGLGGGMGGGTATMTSPAMAAAGMQTMAPLRMLHDVEMDVTVELGRTKMTVRGVLGLTPGSVIELDRAAGAPVDLLVNGKLIGRGEVVVIDEEFGVRISEIIGRIDESI